MKQMITAPATRAVKVTVFEPRQTPEQEEVILEEFELKAGEEREIDISSATAGYRTTAMTDDAVDRDADEDVADANDPFANIPPAQERELTSAAQAEIDAGKSRQQETENREKKASTTRSRSKKTVDEGEEEEQK